MDWINTLYRKIESHKLDLEEANRSIQTLFKAWPNPDLEKKLSDETKDRQNKDPKLTGPSSTPDLTAEEKEGVNLVNQLLHKAQKARDVQKKIEEPKRGTHVRETTQHKSTNNTDKPALQDKKVLSTKNGLVKVTEQSKQIPKSNLIHGVKDAPVNSKVKTLNKAEQSRKVSSSVSLKNPSQCKGSIRDGNKVNGSAGRRVTPAHVSAPFQTNPRLTSAKLKTEYGSSTGKVLSAARNSSLQSTRVKGGYSAPLKKPVLKENTKKSAPQIKTSVNLNNSAQSDGNSDNVSVHSDIDSKACDASSSSVGSHEAEDNGSCEGPTFYNDRKTKDMFIEGSEPEIAGEGPLDEENYFRLSKDGHSLTLPGKFRKLASMNRKLRQRIYTQNVTKKVDSPQPSKEFHTILQQTFEDPDIHTVQMVAKQAEYLLNVYKNLTVLLENLYLQNLSGDSPTEHVLLAKKSLEYILTTFHETESQSRSINLGILRSVDGYVGNQRKKISSHSNPSLRVWYPSTELDFSQHRTLKYRSHKQLERYTSLVHRAQWLQLQIDSMDVMADQTLPLLKSLPPTSSEFIQVLRCCYSLLSTNPNRVPVIVRDSMQDETD